MKTMLAGIRPSGKIHFGHYCMIKPMLVNNKEFNKFCVIADLHSMIDNHDHNQREKNIFELAAACMSLNVCKSNCCLYLQSDVAEILQIYWILSSFIGKSTLERCHAIKNKPEKSISISLFNYPILMAADILSIRSDTVLLGSDQDQHIEICRKLASQLVAATNNKFSLPIPKAMSAPKLVKGIDGRKMSNSYNNIIPLFCSKQELAECVYKIQTSSQSINQIKDVNNNCMFEIYCLFASKEEIEQFRCKYEQGESWKEIKDFFIEKTYEKFIQAKNRYDYLITNKDLIIKELNEGEKLVKEKVFNLVKEVKLAIGLSLSVG